MHKEAFEQYETRIAGFQLELDKMRSLVRQDNDALQPSDRKRFNHVHALEAIDHANESLGALRQALGELLKAVD